MKKFADLTWMSVNLHWKYICRVYDARKGNASFQRGDLQDVTARKPAAF
jgi:hypothetical protein